MRRSVILRTFLLVVAAAGCSSTPPVATGPPPSVIAQSSGDATATPGAQNTAVAPTLAVVESTIAPAPTPAFRTFSDGTYLVNQDIKPGTYRTRESSEGCYWERLSGFSGDDIIENNNTDDPEIVTIPKTDEGFSSERCGIWTSDLSRITESVTSFGPGTYFVNVDIKPGRYRSTGGDGCYWERLKNFLGDGIIDNDNVDRSTIVDIKSSDKGFSSERCGTWTRL